MDALKQEYARILQGLQIDRFNLDEDKYSGVFLPAPFDEYWTAKTKVMLVGRETAGWNTDNNKNTIKRAAGLGGVSVSEVVNESFRRYRKHFELKGDKVVDTSRSRFMQYYFRLARELGLDPRALIYANLFAWDYDKKSPKNAQLASSMRSYQRHSNCLLRRFAVSSRISLFSLRVSKAQMGPFGACLMIISADTRPLKTNWFRASSGSSKRPAPPVIA
ncbi:hypothetical protein UMZ34_21205 [Halopseudomonas pachastrellae]|nr:hypothetical protein UMZ34_21205 [Halopseudomonas pachastrellae]